MTMAVYDAVTRLPEWKLEYFTRNNTTQMQMHTSYPDTDD